MKYNFKPIITSVALVLLMISATPIFGGNKPVQKKERLTQTTHQKTPDVKRNCSNLFVDVIVSTETISLMPNFVYYYNNVTIIGDGTGEVWQVTLTPECETIFIGDTETSFSIFCDIDGFREFEGEIII